MKILMVCLGNICRSPLAEGIMKTKLAENGLNWEVDSAGTGYWHAGELPDPRSIAVARKYGIDITDQRARQIKSADFDDFDWILAMDKSNFRDIHNFRKNDRQKAKVATILSVAQPGNTGEVPDPYWDDQGFEKVFTMLSEACDNIIEQWKKQL